MKFFMRNLLFLIIVSFMYINFHLTHAMEFNPSDYYNEYIRKEGEKSFSKLSQARRDSIKEKYQEWLNSNQDNLGNQQEEKEEDTSASTLSKFSIESSEKTRVRDRLWKKSLNISINNNNYNFIDWFKKEIKSLTKKDFFDLVNNAEEYTDKGDFHNAALHIIACACDIDMGEDYQHILYKVNPLTVKWIEDKYIDFKKLSSVLPGLISHLESISVKKNTNKEELSKYFSDSSVEQSFSFNIIH